MDRILIILKKENGPRALSAPALGLNTIIFKHVYCYMQQIAGERLQTIGPLEFVPVIRKPTEPLHKETNKLHRRKQMSKSALQ